MKANMQVINAARLAKLEAKNPPQFTPTETIPEAHAPPQFTAQYLPLEQVTRPNLTTAETAHYLNRRPQTLRGWACLENGPIRPRRIGGLLAWPTVEVKALAGVA